MDSPVKEDKLVIPSRQEFEPVGGARPEPEEIPVTRVLELDTPVKASVPSPLVRTAGASVMDDRTNRPGVISTKLSIVDNAVSAAQVGGKNCVLCHWWNQELWRKVYPKWTHSNDPALQQGLNQARSIFPDDEDGTSESAMWTQFGVCMAMTELFGNTKVFHRACTCPETGPDGRPLPLMFMPRDADARRLSEAVYSRVLKIAAGKGR